MDRLTQICLDMTPFQKRVYSALKKVPKGRVTTYKFLAHAVGCGSARAVGQALKRNPYAPEVPCHRVIASDLTIGGFRGGRSGKTVAAKSELLRREGVTFDANGRLLRKDKIYYF